jgi:hypothetical protein
VPARLVDITHVIVFISMVSSCTSHIVKLYNITYTYVNILATDMKFDHEFSNEISFNHVLRVKAPLSAVFIRLIALIVKKNVNR